MDYSGKRICFISAYHKFCPAGGAEYQTYLISEELQKKGARIFYISPYSPRNQDEVIVENGKTIYCYKRRLERKLFGSNYLFSLNIVRKYLNQIKPDIIFQRGVSSITGLCSWYSRKNQVPFIVSIASDVNLAKVNLIRTLRYPLNVIDTVLGQHGLKKSSSIIVQSYSQLNHLKDRYHRDAFLIRNMFYKDMEIGIDIGKKKDQIICFCKYNQNKSPEVCFKMAELLPHRKFVIAGLDHDISKLKKYSKFTAVPGNVYFAGKLNRNQFLQVLSESKILLSTSLYEGFSNTFIEAWINKTAVVSLNVNPDNFFDGDKYGYYARGDLSVAESQIEKLMCNAEEFMATVQSSYIFAKKEFDLDGNMRKIERLICNFDVRAEQIAEISCHLE